MRSTAISASATSSPALSKISSPPTNPLPAQIQIDVAAGRPGYARVEDAADKVLRLLKENKGRLPYHDKSDPEAIYSFFGMSKKTFKMTTGKLYKERKISITNTEIILNQT